jgi:tetratricopeptide (TPR) repeat protein
LAARAAAVEVTEASKQGFGSKVVLRFAERIEEDLKAEPVGISAEEHRELLADLLRRLGELNHYQLLGLAATASAQEIHYAYNNLARRVHPMHAGTLGLEGKETAFEVLFERATEAYLTLSDPTRRSSYNMVSGLFEGITVDPGERDVERRSLAQQNYRHGARLLSSMDVSQAVDLLKEAARIDPQVDYLCLLGQAQAKNPKWWDHAETSFQRAISASPQDVRPHLGYAELLESMDRLEAAIDEYQAALEIEPHHPMALLALERMGVRPKSKGMMRASFGRLGKKVSRKD